MRVLAGSTIDEYKMKPRFSVDNTSSLSCKRQASQGEGPGGGGQSAANRYKNAKFECRLCGKVIARSTKHPVSACRSHASKMGRDTMYISDIVNDEP